ncbi:MAG: ParB/RepB/Spo0J family partition protein [Deltaproteobacteria bacterium]|nr:ParB/RepB/Spo0J family partition protein [Deltaproteobacteria bacterium]
MATTETYAPNRLYTIPLAELMPDPNQPRKYFDPVALEELTASVAQNGVMSPIFFRVENGLKYIVAGERRCAAARKAGLANIPAIYVETQNYTEISLIENMVRSDLTPVEEAEALDRLMQDHKYQPNDLIRILSKSQPYISETLSLARLPKEVRDECRQNPAVSKKALLEIAKKKQERSMLKAYWEYKAKLNPQKKTGAGAKLTKAQGAFNAMDATQRKIRTLDMQILTPEEKQNFIIAMNNLKRVIENTLAAATKEIPGKNLA